MFLPPLAELLASMQVIRLPLTTFFRGTKERELVLFEGPQGWGEFAPFRDHSDEHSAMWLRAAIEAAYESWPTPVRDSIEVNAIVPSLNAKAAGEWAAKARQDYGISTFKIKCGSANFSDDVARVESVCTAVDDISNLKIRLDVNAGWSLKDATQRIPVLQQATKQRIEYVEQPVKSLTESATLRESIDVKVAVDESIRLQGGTYDEIRAAADVAILKAIPLGGVQRSLQIAQDLDMPCIVSGSLDSSVGLSQGIALAAALPNLAGACGLATAQLFARDVVQQPTIAVDGKVKVGRVSPQNFEATSDSELRDYWQDRLTTCYRILESM